MHKNSKTMAHSTLYKIGKALTGSTKTAKPTKTANYTIKIDNYFKKRSDLDNRTNEERLACDIFSKFYGNVPGAISVKEESLPLTTYANCLRTLKQKLEQDASPTQLVSVLWGKMTISSTPKSYKSECANLESYRYSPNYEHEKTLIFAGLMVAVKLSYPNTEKADEIVNTIRTSAHSKENLEYFKPFDKAINAFNPSEISIGLIEVINAIKSTTKPYKTLALYEFLCKQFSNDESAIEYIKKECSTVPMSEPETGTHIENVNVTNGGAMNMFDNSDVHNEFKALPSSETKKLIGNEHQ